MTKMKRYSPLMMLFDFVKLLKTSFFFVIYLYVVKADSESLFTKYGRLVFLLAVGLTLLSIIYKWFTHRYEMTDQSFHLYKGLFKKSKQTIPFSKIQNISRHTSFFHRLFKMTSIHFETGMTGGSGTIKFKVIPQIEAKRMEAHLKNADQNHPVDLNHQSLDSGLEIRHESLNRTIHFQPTKKDVFKASFTSLSFLILIPLASSFYYKINEIFHVDEAVDGFFEMAISSWWVVTIIVMLLVIASTTFGIARTYLKYGKYEISSDSNYIYITRGVIDETAFSISKEKVQAIEINQSLMKRLLRLAEVKLRSSGPEEESLDIHTLYPFLPVNKAYKMVSDMLPSYEITEEMSCLSGKSFWVRILRPSLLWMIATIAFIYFKPTIWDIEQAWVILSITLLLCILIVRLLDFSHTRYAMNDQMIQFQKGALTTSLFISKREKVIEVKMTRNIVQKMLGLSSIETMNRGKPVHYSGVHDVPVELANFFFQWYVGRKKEVKVE